MKVSGHELKLGDIVKLNDSPYSYATVKKVDGDSVNFFRPYVHVDDSLVYSGGVICYVGIEEFSTHKNQEFILFTKT